MRMAGGSIGRGLRLSLGRMGPVLLIIGLEARESIAQCALCRDAVVASSTETRAAMNSAIIGLAFAPYLVAGLAAWALFPSLRNWVRTRWRNGMRGKREVHL
jgi:hypothetical protein